MEVAAEVLEGEGLLLVKPGRAPLLMDGVVFALFQVTPGFNGHPASLQGSVSLGTQGVPWLRLMGLFTQDSVDSRFDSMQARAATQAGGI